MYLIKKSNFLLILCIIIITITSCSNNTYKTSNSTSTLNQNLFLNINDTNEVELNYFSHEIENGTRTKIISSFEKKYPHIKINLIALPSNTDKKLEILLYALNKKDSSIDLFDADITWPAILVNQNLVAPLNNYITTAESDLWIDSAVSANTINNNIYGVPYRLDAGMLYYRKDLLSKYNFSVPRTWDELINISKYIMKKEPNMYGYAGSWKAFEGLTCNLLEFLWSFDGRLFSKKNELILSSSNNLKAITTMVNFRNKHHITPKDILNYSSGDARELFNSGHLVFLRDWSSEWSKSQDPNTSQVINKIDIANIPNAIYNKTTPSVIGGWQIMVSNYSNHKKEAALFAKYRASEYPQILSAKNLSHLPTLKSLYKNESVLKELPFLKKIKNIISNTKYRPIHPNYHEISKLLQTMTHNIFTFENTPAQGLKETELKISELLNKENQASQ